MLDGLEVFWPFDYVYPEQYEYMQELKTCLDARGNGLLEMPTGTGKTVSLLALITSYQRAHPQCGKLIYCTRTVQEMAKTIEEVKRVIAYRERVLAEEAGGSGAEAASRAMGLKGDLLAVCLSTRRNLCIHPQISEETERDVVDAKCRALTSTWIRAKAGAAFSSSSSSSSSSSAGGSERSGRGCDFYEGLQRESEGLDLRGIYDLDDLKRLGQEKGYCPYFLARQVLASANVVVYNYQYMLDPKISSLVTRSLDERSIVVFDEAHNIDNVCLEALSVTLDKKALDAAAANLSHLGAEVKRVKRVDANRLNAEYARLVRGLGEAEGGGGGRGGGGGGGGGGGAAAAPGVDIADVQPAPAVLPADVLQEAMPGTIRNAELFVRYMTHIVRHLRGRICVRELQTVIPTQFLKGMKEDLGIDVTPLRYAYTRLQSLLRTLEVTALEDFGPLTSVCDFVTLLGTYARGFLVITEPTRPRAPHIPDPLMQLVCLDAGIALRPVLEKYASVILTSGTLSPLDMYPRILDFKPCVSRSLRMSIERQNIFPCVVARAADQTALSSKFERREDGGVIAGYGRLVVDVCATVPDGVIAFFVSYSYMESMVSAWAASGVLRALEANKLIFMETKDVVETTLALTAYRAACDAGRGALLLSIARGKVAEGIDFDRHYGRAVLLFGIPFQYVLSVVLRARMAFLRDAHQVTERDYLNFDALRQAAQCCGRIIRSKRDYGIIVFADHRYGDADKLGKLPEWIKQFLPSRLNLSTDRAVGLMKKFLRELAQPPIALAPGQASRTLLTLEDVNALQRERAEAVGGGSLA